MEVASTNKTKTSHPSAALPRERWLCPLYLLAERLVYEHLHLMSSGLVSVVSITFLFLVTFYFKKDTVVQFARDTPTGNYMQLLVICHSNFSSCPEAAVAKKLRNTEHESLVAAAQLCSPVGSFENSTGMSKSRTEDSAES